MQEKTPDTIETMARVAAEILRKSGHCYPSDLDRHGFDAEAIARHYDQVMIRARQIRAAPPSSHAHVNGAGAAGARPVRRGGS